MRNISAGRHPARYEIRIQGHLAPRWATWFDGMTLSTGSDGSTVLTGLVVDQAALHGLLATLRDIGLPLVSVTALDAKQSAPPRTPPLATPGASYAATQGD